MPSMVQKDTPPSTPLNLREMMDDDLDEDDFVEIALEDLEQMSDVDTGDEGNESDDSESNTADDSKLVFSQHEGSVFSCHIDPKEGKLAVTGGEDEKAFIWDTTSGESIFVGRDFKDSVVSVEFNHDGKYVAAADMSGVLKVWKITNTTTPQEIWADNVEDILWVKWHNKANVLLCGVCTGEVYMWKIPSGECKLLSGHGCATDVGQFMPDGKRAVVGYKDGVIKVFDLSTCSVQSSLANPEIGTILCLSSHPDSNLIAAGTLNAKVVLFAAHNGKVVSLFSCRDEVIEDDEVETVETVAFARDASLPHLAIATVNSVQVWDYSKQVLRHRHVFKEGVTKLLWGLLEGVIYIGTQTGDVKVMDARSCTLIAQFKGHRAPILEMVLSRDGKKLVTASDDHTSRIFQLEQHQPLQSAET